ncbi:MAG: pyruvate kinase [Candidatus Omnitrophica bacterium]|nr:pyruvate kinase [Candidatus Omnitrophota bacterium]
MYKTRIVATLGPASADYSVIRKMTLAGMDVARLNFSHGKEIEHENKIRIIRKINDKYRRHIRILGDLEGFRIRIGYLKEPGFRVLRRSERVTFFFGEDKGSRCEIPFDYDGDFRTIAAGKMIYADDGNIVFKVLKSSAKKVIAETVVGGTLKERKGINIPEAKFPGSGVTEKDAKDIEFSLRHGVDHIAQSFVRSKKDILRVRELFGGRGPGKGLVAKIETREAIRDIDGIIEVSDGIMIARGDMGVAVPISMVPVIQKEIIRKCNYRKRYVITATQMLESMTEHSRPTRAEVTDVANAILDGTDMVMLSGETAVGKYPVEAIRTMNDIIGVAEGYKKNRAETVKRILA